MQLLTRRDFLKMVGLSFVGLGLAPFEHYWGSESGERLCRVTAHFIHLYSQPDFSAERLARRFRDELLHVYYDIDTGVGRNSLWNRVWGGFVYSGFLQPVDYILNEPLESLPAGGQLLEVSVPFTQSVLPKTKDGWMPNYRLYFGSVHWGGELLPGPDGEPWYLIEDFFQRKYLAKAAHLKPVEDCTMAPLSTEVPPGDKHILVSRPEQYLWAYEGDTVVLESKISSGVPDREDLPEGEIPRDTPPGSYHITVKTPTRHMGSKRMSADPESGALPGVPWVCFFDKTGYALHGTYWHANFGNRMSSGCINLPNPAALWLYRWTTPAVPPGERQFSAWGTRVDVL